MLLCFGSNYFGQLGVGIDRRSNLHEPLVFGRSSDSYIPADDVVDIQCGGNFTTVLVTDGTVMVCGSLNGRIFPSLRRFEIPYPIKCTQLACGRKHILALMEGGYCLSWGTGHFGQLGHGDDTSWDNPKMLHSLEPRAISSRVVHIACGASHSAALTESGKLFMWGLNKNGQCGILGKAECILEPKLVEYGDNNIKPVSVACGRNHSAMLTSDGRLYAWGSTSYGRLGIANETRKMVPLPTEVAFFHNIPIYSIASGDFHMMALTHDCSVYSWGYGADGQLGHGNLNHCKVPRRIDFFDASMQITEISCGAWWSMAVSKAGALYAWGYGERGLLGIQKPAVPLPYLETDTTPASSTSQPRGENMYTCQTFDSTFDVMRPQRVRSLSRFVVDRVRCGGTQSVIFCTPRIDVDMAEYASESEESVTAKNSSVEGLAGADVRELTAQLFAWSRHRKLQELEYALSRGSDVNIRDSLGNTPLIVACQNGHMSVATLLMKYGADVSAKNKTGNTALHYAFAFGFDELGQYLIAEGADEYATNVDGMTAYEGLNRDDMDNH